MSGHSTAAESLRDEGYRLTPQRMMILKIIYDSQGHISAEEIHQRVRQQYPFVDISTVYRTLNLLKKLRLITETDLGGGSVRYECLEHGRHHHLVCRQCGASFPLEHSLLAPLEKRLLREYGFAADLDHFAIFGLCPKCRAQPAERTRKHGPH
jgi:Fur family ferric uptake transcriptional regulator